LRGAARPPGAIATVAELQPGVSRVFVVVTDQDSDFSAEQRARMAEALEVSVPADLDYYQNWPAIPKHALLIAFASDENSLEVDFDGYWTSSDGRNIKVPGVAGGGYPVTKADLKTRREIGLTGNIQWKSSVSAVVRLFKTQRGLGTKLRKESGGSVQYARPTDWCMPVHDMLLLCAKHGCPVPVPWRTELAKVRADAALGTVKAQ